MASIRNNLPELYLSPSSVDSIWAVRAKRWLRVFFWILTGLTGFLQAWSARFTLSQDGNNYLDIADAYLRADFAHAINAYWSPFFSWLAAIPLYLFEPSGYWDSTLLHLLNVAGLLIGLCGFEYFFVAFLEVLAKQKLLDSDHALDEFWWWALGYGLFFSTMLFVITEEPTTPDMWVCVTTYFAMGTLLRIKLHPRKARYYLLLGILLGIGYLTKSFYFPLSFVYFLAIASFARNSRRSILWMTLALVMFTVVSGPFIWEISKAKGRFTFGDVGKIGYSEFVNPIPQPFFWQGGDQSGAPKHPPRRILARPAIFEFATPVGGSYPPSYDMSYWLDGLKPHFHVRGQLRIFRQSFGTFFLIFLTQLEFAVGLAIFFFCLEKRSSALVSIAGLWPLWIVPAAGCVAYSFVLVENRYVAPFLVFLWLAAFAGVANSSVFRSRRFALAVVLGMLSITGIKAAKLVVSDLAVMRQQENQFWQVAQGLHQLGVQPGDKVAIITGNAVAHWARLAGVKIVAELPLGQESIFWEEDPSARKVVYASFASTGSRVVVVKDPPLDAGLDNWQKLGNTSYYARPLP